MNDQLDRIESLFHKARMLVPADRGSFLDESCRGELELRAEVESLLAHSDRRTLELDLQPDERNGDVDQATIIDRGPVPEGPGTRIGPYKILQQIGEGGFGVVYMAEQQEPVQRKVALKIIKLGMDTKQVIARFEAERQALAMMDHPNIARVLEAGATETGRPYFVMELVKGIPITEYCDKAKLPTIDRLNLFMQVCQAIQHAHQKGIIHRDIKPSNVLVTLHDTRAVPKVIDFGIAKATSRSLTEKTLFTEFRYFIGTPEYMSPDQAEISGLDVDTRTDIYSLGVLLYELLTGTTPFDGATLRKAAYGEIQRIIREVDPPKPSTRVVTLNERGTDIARYRQTEPGALGKLVRGDLDWIVMKAMDKDRTRRYQSAGEFVSDIERYLRQQPILAGPPSVAYKFSKFVARHRLGVMASAFIAAALVAGLSLATIGLVKARQEADRSQRIADFLQDLLVSTNPDRAVVDEIDVQQVVATARDVFGEDHATVAATLTSRALQLQSGGDLRGAEDLYRQALDLWRDQFGNDHLNVGTTLTRLGVLLLTKGDDSAAEAALREAIAILDMQEGENRRCLAEPMFVLSSLLTNRGGYDEAEALARESIRITEASAPSQRLQVAMMVSALTNLVVMAGKDEEAAVLMPELVAAWREALPPDSAFLGRILTQVGLYYVQRDDDVEAERVLAEAREILGRTPESAILQRAQIIVSLRRIFEQRGDTLAAIPLAMEAVEIAPQVEGGRHVNEAVRELGNLAWHVAREAGQTEEAYRLALGAIERVQIEQPDAAAYLNTLGVLQYRLGRDEAALETLARSHAFYSEKYEGGVPADLAFMAMAHHRLGHAEEARLLMDGLRAAMLNPALPPREDNARHMAEAQALLGGG